MQPILGRLGLAMSLSVGLLASASAHEVLVNGNFETGNFSGWTASSTQTSPFQASFGDGRNAAIANSTSGQPAWYVRNQAANYFGTPATPIAGYSAFNGFDGSGGNFTLSQGFSLTGNLSSALLGFTFGTQATYSGTNRTFSVDVMNAGGSAALANLYAFVLPQNSTTWTLHDISLDVAAKLNALGAGNYRLQFTEVIPSNYTGPAQFAIDNISLNVNNAVPEPSSIALVGAAGLALLALRRNRRAR